MESTTYARGATVSPVISTVFTPPYEIWLLPEVSYSLKRGRENSQTSRGTSAKKLENRSVRATREIE